jgi:signal recognition particle subunit SEC65
MKNPKRVRAGRKAWRGKGRKNWFKSQKDYKKVLESKGYKILVSHKGYPDYMVRKNRKISFREVKKNNDPLEKEQKEVIKRLRKAGFDVKIIRYRSSLGKFEVSKE